VAAPAEYGEGVYAGGAAVEVAVYGTEVNGGVAYADTPAYNVAGAGGAPQYDLATGGNHNPIQYDLATGGDHNPIQYDLATGGDHNRIQYDLATGGDHNRNQYDLATGGNHNRYYSAATYAIPIEGDTGSAHEVSSSVRTTSFASTNTPVYGATPGPQAVAVPARRVTKRVQCERPAPTGGSCMNNPASGGKFCPSHACPVVGCRAGKSSSEGGCSLHLDVERAPSNGIGIRRVGGGGAVDIGSGVSRGRQQSTYGGFDSEDV
jgi:hypothetical protein